MPENIGTVDICLMKDKDTARPLNVSVFVTEISSTGSSATGRYRYCCGRDIVNIVGFYT